MKSIRCLMFIFVCCMGAAITPAFSAQVQSSATLQWRDNSNNELGFGIEMFAPAGSDFVEVGIVDSNVSQFSLTLTGNSGDEFCFRVYAFNAAGDSADSNIACKTLSDAPSLPPVDAPSKPEGLEVRFASAGGIGVSWNDVQNEAEYLVQRQRGDATEMEIILPANQTSFRDENLVKSETYCYRVAAINRIGSSQFTEYVCADTKPVEG
jgi:hypothetical protein